ncbi:response regulator, partial [Candidatus Aerophobetes bacterium]
SPKSVVIMITGYAGEELVKEAMKEGAYALLYKPFCRKTIFDIIKKVLEGLS